MLFVGCDLSTTSPGLTLYDTFNQSLLFVGWAQRKRDKPGVYSMPVSDSLPFPVKRAELKLLDELDGDRFCRMTKIIDDVVDLIHETTAVAPAIFIEGYAFNAKSSSVTKMAELGGAFRIELMRQEWTWTDIQPSTGKKDFAGTGIAAKGDMAAAYHRLGFPALEPILGSQDHQHPNEDIIDSLGVLISGLILHEVIEPIYKKTKKRKRKE